MAKLAEQSYVQALMSIATEDNSVDKYQDFAESLLQTLYSETDFLEFLRSPVIKKEDKKKIIDDVYGEVFDKNFINFLKVVIDKNRMSSIMEMLRSFIKECKNSREITEVLVETARELTDQQIDNLKEVLNKKLNRKIIIKQKINESLIAGIKVIFDQKIIDTSVENTLKELKERFYQTIV